MPHPQGDARILEWKLRIWLDTRCIINGNLALCLLFVTVQSMLLPSTANMYSREWRPWRCSNTASDEAYGKSRKRGIGGVSERPGPLTETPIVAAAQQHRTTSDELRMQSISRRCAGKHKRREKNCSTAS